jgi:hypothetical protein
MSLLCLVYRCRGLMVITDMVITDSHHGFASNRLLCCVWPANPVWWASEWVWKAAEHL